MRSMVGPRVSGKDFFGREAEMAALRQLVQDGNHILLTGQRRMGKTSIAWELGERLSEEENWLFLPVDVEQATSSEDVVTLLYDEYRLKTMRSRAARLAVGLGDVARNVQEVGLRQMRVKFRKGLTAGNWARHGNDLLRKCARQKRRVLIVVDELPIFLSRRRGKDGRRQADEFMSWLRQGFQTVQGQAPPVLIVSGSIGLKPLVDRLGLSDRINYLHPFRLGPMESGDEHRLHRGTREQRRHGAGRRSGGSHVWSARLGHSAPCAVVLRLLAHGRYATWRRSTDGRRCRADLPRGTAGTRWPKTTSCITNRGCRTTSPMPSTTSRRTSSRKPRPKECSPPPLDEAWKRPWTLAHRRTLRPSWTS